MDIVVRIQEILSTRGLTLHRVSRRSADAFGVSSPFYIPHNLYHRLSHSSFRPTISQILALSHISGYQLFDWLAVFGFDLDALSRVQLLIPRQRTTVLDSAVYDMFGWVPWLAERSPDDRRSSIAPLGHFVRWAVPRRTGEFVVSGPSRFVYARVGEDDLYARPQLVPGSIVRADSARSGEFVLNHASASESRFFLVEHRSGWTCSRLIAVAHDRVLLHCPQRPYIERELRLEKDVRVMGFIDAEIRPVGRSVMERQPACSPLPNADLMQCGRTPSSLRELLVRSRTRVGLSYREASSLSWLIAKMLSDRLYFAAAGTLSDYEASDTPPRHIQKILTICILYGIGFDAFLRACGLPLDRAGHDPMPDDLAQRRRPNGNCGLQPAKDDSGRQPNGPLSSLLQEWQEVPLFLKSSLDVIAGIKKMTLSDVFWVAGSELSDPLLKNDALAVVNRRAKRPRPFDPAAARRLPLYLLLKRDGTYVCSRCSLDRDILRIHSYAGGGKEPQEFRNGVDIEIVGEVTTIARLL